MRDKTDAPLLKPAVIIALAIALVALFVIPMVVAPRPTGEDEEAFGGTDAKVTEILEEDKVEPWFSPIFEPGSGEIESGLFALQAAIGAGIGGFALGNLRGRHVQTRKTRESVDV